MPENSNLRSIDITKDVNRADSPPAYFLSLTVENIRCFGPEQVLDLSDGNGRPAPWTIILGDNGFGKTTLLQCLFGMEPTLLDLRHRENAAIKLGWEPRFSASTSGYSYFEDNFIRSLPASVASSIFYGSKLKSSVKGKAHTPYSITAKKGLWSTWAADIGEDEDIGGVVCYCYGATRRMGTGSLSTERDAYTYFTNSLFSENVSLINAEEWYLQADYSSHRSPSRKSQAQQLQVKEALVQLLPNVQDIRIADFDDGVRVEVKTPFGWVHIQSLSLGYRTLIAWVVDLAHRLFERYPKSKNPLAEPAVVLVDEIDLHLHPRFQRDLMVYLTDLFPNTQFIATAHSPLVVQAASNANIALLRQEGDHVVIDNDVEAIAGWRIDQVLTSDLFGLKSARPPQFDLLLAERTRILSKGRLTKADRNRLQVIEAEIGDLPTGETPNDLKAMDIIRQAAKLLSNS